jgi:5-methyltetrahydropteroyltriglutamate--homocysteine methyltransferase
MKASSGRIVTTHTGSLPRPPALLDRYDGDEVRAAVFDVARRQREAGVDIINDGEVSKPSYATYVTERLSGFTGEPVPREWTGRGYDDFPEFFQKQRSEPPPASVADIPSCNGPVTYADRSQVEVDIANLKAASDGADLFMTAASPGTIQLWMPNRYYPSTQDYIFALADAMKEEYDAICAAGIVLQLDCPDLACLWVIDQDLTFDEFRQQVAMRVEALNNATRDIPPESMRLHLCWGNGEGPHHTDVALADIIDLVLEARPAAISFEGANPRHEHEWKLFEEVKLPDGKVIIPGVLDSTTNFIEHPDLVAQRLVRYAAVVGKANVIAGSDCGFATVAGSSMVDPRIAWAKLAAMAEGARLASEHLWGQRATVEPGTVSRSVPA